MQQQINLYRSLPQAMPEKLSPLLMGQLCNTFIVLLLLIWCSELIYNTILEGRIFYLKEQQAEVTKALANITKQYPRAFKNARIQQQNQQLMKTIAQKKQLLQNLAGSPESAQYTGFSKYLIALGQAIIPNVWLTEISILSSGKDITLKGSATLPSAVMQFLQNLSKEPSFVGKKFKILQLTHDKQYTGQVDFIITTEATKPPVILGTA